MKKHVKYISMCMLIIICLTLTSCNSGNTKKDVSGLKTNPAENVKEDKIDFVGKTVTLEYINNLIHDE